jgi:hypothetical protein
MTSVATNDEAAAFSSAAKKLASCGFAMSRAEGGGYLVRQHRCESIAKALTWANNVIGRPQIPAATLVRCADAGNRSTS